MNDILHILLGAVLVFLGVIAGAIADRIRSAPADRPQTRQRSQTSRPGIHSAADIDHSGLYTHISIKTEPTAAPVTVAHAAMAKDVALALTTMGYTKPDAIKAVNACAGSECATIETWTRAALKRCARKEAAS